MTNKERFIATIERRAVDRPATWLGEPVKDAIDGLLNHFRKNSLIDLKKSLQDDVYEVNIPYHSPISDHVAAAFDFAAGTSRQEYEHRTLTAPGFFEDCSDPKSVDHFSWPDPKLYIEPTNCVRVFDNIPNDAAVMVLAWSAHFQDACAAFGMEQALVTMMTNPEMFQAVIDKIVQFYLQANEIFYSAATQKLAGRLDAVLIGNDFGTQTGLLLDPQLIRKLVLPGTKVLIEQAHSFGLKVVHHSCGSIVPIIPDLINLGVDAIHPIQALANNMSAEALAQSYGNEVSFCGGVDAQHLLVHGDALNVYKRVRELTALFPTGLIVSPSHEAILPDTKPSNIEAMFKAVAES